MISCMSHFPQLPQLPQVPFSITEQEIIELLLSVPDKTKEEALNQAPEGRWEMQKKMNWREMMGPKTIIYDHLSVSLQ